MNPDWDYLLKLIVVGDSSVGKSAIISRYINDHFDYIWPSTIAIDCFFRTLDIDGKRVKLQFWDTGGQERFRTISRAYYRSVHGVLFVYDICDRRSFDNIEMWMKEADTYGTDDPVRVIVANKSDKDKKSHQVTMEEGVDLARRYNVPFVVVSAKDNLNITNTIDGMAKAMIDVAIRINNQKEPKSKPVNVAKTVSPVTVNLSCSC